MNNLPKNLTSGVQHAENKCESAGTMELSRESIGDCEVFLRQVLQSFDLCSRNMHFQCCMSLQGTLGGDFDNFAASSESTAWKLFWKTIQDQVE